MRKLLLATAFVLIVIGVTAGLYLVASVSMAISQESPPAIIIQEPWWKETVDVLLPVAIIALSSIGAGVLVRVNTWLGEKFHYETAKTNEILAKGMELTMQNGLKAGADHYRVKLGIGVADPLPARTLPGIIEYATNYAARTRPDSVKKLDIKKELPEIISTRVPDVLSGVVEGVSGPVAGASAATPVDITKKPII